MAVPDLSCHSTNISSLQSSLNLKNNCFNLLIYLFIELAIQLCIAALELYETSFILLSLRRLVKTGTRTCNEGNLVITH